MYVGAGESRLTVGQICQKCEETLKFWLNNSFVFILFCLNSTLILYNSGLQNQMCDWTSVRPKPGFGIGNRNQDQVSVSVSGPELFLPKPKLKDDTDI